MIIEMFRRTCVFNEDFWIKKPKREVNWRVNICGCELLTTDARMCSSIHWLKTSELDTEFRLAKDKNKSIFRLWINWPNRSTIYSSYFLKI